MFFFPQLFLLHPVRQAAGHSDGSRWRSQWNVLVWWAAVHGVLGFHCQGKSAMMLRVIMYLFLRVCCRRIERWELQIILLYFTGLALPFCELLQSQEIPVWVAGWAGTRFWGEWRGWGCDFCDFSWCKKWNCCIVRGGNICHILCSFIVVMLSTFLKKQITLNDIWNMFVKHWKGLAALSLTPAYRWTPLVWIQQGLCWCLAVKMGPSPSGTPAATRHCSKSTAMMEPSTTWPSVPVRVSLSAGCKVVTVIVVRKPAENSTLCVFKCITWGTLKSSING